MLHQVRPAAELLLVLFAQCGVGIELALLPEIFAVGKPTAVFSAKSLFLEVHVPQVLVPVFPKRPLYVRLQRLQSATKVLLSVFVEKFYCFPLEMVFLEFVKLVAQYGVFVLAGVLAVVFVLKQTRGRADAYAFFFHFQLLEDLVEGFADFRGEFGMILLPFLFFFFPFFVISFPVLMGAAVAGLDPFGRDFREDHAVGRLIVFQPREEPLRFLGFRPAGNSKDGVAQLVGKRRIIQRSGAIDARGGLESLQAAKFG
ncbi:MAG: hypothetical protein K6U09_03955 [Acidobacteriia bacterium]|nr:hypothetical protein [Terriglobia bacterium]